MLQHIFYTASEMTVYEEIPSKFVNKNTHFSTSPVIELESPSCLPCLEKPEKDNIIMFTKIFLKLIKHALELNLNSKNGIFEHFKHK